ncbi:MAG TPA: GspH/FimT family pseudopilin [Woeseiaceae bacterium]|nr:GspH/FimT family pseudopilin [Woeseiaceae bacterium]
MQGSTTAMSAYSLFELLVTLAVASILLAVGVPSFSSVFASNRQHAEINALFHAIHVARKESIMRKRVVSLCPSVDGKQCNPGRDWSSGWLMFDNIDRDEPPMVDAGEALLTVHEVDPLIQLTANRRGFTLRATHLRATNGTFVVCDRNNRSAPRALVVSYTGRPRAARTNAQRQRYACAD